MQVQKHNFDSEYSPVNAAQKDPVAKAPSIRNWCEIGILCLLGSVLFYVFSRTSADPDLWGHVKFGEDLWHTGRIVRDDIYSYLSDDQPWINHEWLAEAAFAAVFNVAGVSGLIVFKSCLALLIAAILYCRLRRQLAPVSRAAMLAVAFTSSLIPYLGVVRPQVFTFLIFLLVLIVLEKADRGQARWLWWVPALLAIAVNVHGGVLAAAGIFFLWVGLILISTVFREKSLAVVFAPANRMIILVSFAAIAALALNPYGIRLPVFLLRTATVARPEIAEWQPIALISVEGLVYVLLLVVSCMGMIFSRKERRPAVVILFACTAMLPLIASRHMPLFGLSCAVLIGEHIADMWDRGAPAADATGADDARSSWFAVACLVAAPVMIAIAWPNFQCIRVDGRKTEFPVRAVALLKQTNATGNLVVHFDWGEYALWHLGPRMKVSIDGRRETVYSERSYAENLRFTNGVGDWDRLLKEPKTQVALVSRAFPVFNLMRLTSGWKLAYEDPISGIFVRQGSPLEEALRLTRRPEMPHNGAGLCFP